MKKIFYIYFIFFAFGLLNAQTSDPQNVKYVSPLYSNTAPYYSSISNALQNAAKNDIIIVFPAVYNEAIKLIDSVTLILNSGVLLTNAYKPIRLDSSISVHAQILGDGIIESTGAFDAVYLYNSTTGKCFINIECKEIRAPLGNAVNINFGATDFNCSIKCNRIYAKLSSLYGTFYDNTTNFLNLSCDTIYTLNGNSNTNFSIYTSSGRATFNVGCLAGSGPLLNFDGGIIEYTGYTVRNSYNPATSLKIINTNFMGSIDRIINKSGYPSIDIQTNSDVNLNVSDSIYNSNSNCIKADSTCSININAGFVINSGNSGNAQTLMLNCNGYFYAKEVQNLSTDPVYFGRPTDLLTVSAKFIRGNSGSNMIVIDSDNLALQNCELSSISTGIYGISTSLTPSPTRNVRIYGTCFTNVPKQYLVNYITGHETNTYYVK